MKLTKRDVLEIYLKFPKYKRKKRSKLVDINIIHPAQKAP